jgi:hypothetical protein
LGNYPVYVLINSHKGKGLFFGETTHGRELIPDESGNKKIDIRTHLKNRILVQDRGGAEFQTAGNLLVVEDLKRGTNKDIGPKDIFEMGSTKVSLCSSIDRCR